MAQFSSHCRCSPLTHCNALQHAATCSTLQHAAAHCNTLQHNAAHCNTLPHTVQCHWTDKTIPAIGCRQQMTWCSQKRESFRGIRCRCYPPCVLQVCCRCVAGVLQVCCGCVAGVMQGSVLQYAAMCCSMLQRVAVCCSVLQCAAV